MSKMKKIIISAIIGIITILGLHATSYAYTSLADKNLTKGQEIEVGYDEYVADKNVFCVQHGQQLHTWDIKYTVLMPIKLEGTTCTRLSNGEQFDAKSNAVMAYILNTNEGTTR